MVRIASSAWSRMNNRFALMPNGEGELPPTDQDYVAPVAFLSNDRTNRNYLQMVVDHSKTSKKFQGALTPSNVSKQEIGSLLSLIAGIASKQKQAKTDPCMKVSSWRICLVHGSR